MAEEIKTNPSETPQKPTLTPIKRTRNKDAALNKLGTEGMVTLPPHQRAAVEYPWQQCDRYARAQEVCRMPLTLQKKLDYLATFGNIDEETGKRPPKNTILRDALENHVNKLLLELGIPADEL